MSNAGTVLAVLILSWGVGGGCGTGGGEGGGGTGGDGIGGGGTGGGGTGGGGTGGPTGDVTFWTDYAAATPPLTVEITINGRTHPFTTTSTYPRAPTCRQAGTYTLQLPAGTHPYTAKPQVDPTGGKVTWSGSVTVTQGGCTMHFLESPLGELSLEYGDQYAPVRIEMNNQYVGTIQAPLQSNPICGGSGPGVLTLTLKTGQYSVRATDSRGRVFTNLLVYGSVYPARCTAMGMGPFL